VDVGGWVPVAETVRVGVWVRVRVGVWVGVLVVPALNIVGVIVKVRIRVEVGFLVGVLDRVGVGGGFLLGA
jgi:hypothetical protein